MGQHINRIWESMKFSFRTCALFCISSVLLFALYFCMFNIDRSSIWLYLQNNMYLLSSVFAYTWHFSLCSKAIIDPLNFDLELYFNQGMYTMSMGRIHGLSLLSGKTCPSICFVSSVLFGQHLRVPEVRKLCPDSMNFGIPCPPILSHYNGSRF